MHMRTGFVILAIALNLCATVNAEARQISVDVAGGGDYVNLRRAYLEAASHDTLHLEPGAHEFSGTIDKPITIRGEDVATTVVTTINSMAISASDVHLETFHLSANAGGRSLVPAIAVNGGNVRVLNCIVGGGHAALWAINGGEIHIRDSVIRGILGAEVVGEEGFIDARSNYWVKSPETDLNSEEEITGFISAPPGSVLFDPWLPVRTVVCQSPWGLIKGGAGNKWALATNHCER